ncbi:MAG: winged helix-turn-helix domain-containing protein [Methanomassiliicoccales archaeon]
MQALETSSLLTEEYSIKVLVATMGLPKSVNELSEKLGIPIAACYRRIRSLEKAGLLYCVDRGLTQKGKRVSLYKAKIKNGMILLEKNKVRVKLDMIDGSVESYDYDALTSSPSKESEKPIGTRCD